MLQQSRNSILYVLLVLFLGLLFALDLIVGSVSIPVDDVFHALSGGSASTKAWDYIILQYRLPKALTAVLVGAGLSVSGLLMQTLFRNPLAGPYVLGLTSGSSLAVALLILGGTWLNTVWAFSFISEYSLVLASCMGSFIVMMAVLFVSQKLKDTMAMLIVGLMFGSFTSAFVGILTYFSTAEQLQKFTFWSLGNLSNLSWHALNLLGIAVALGLLLALACLKSLDALLLGENYAKSLGLNFEKSKLLIILSTGILTGSITAFAGPIAFVGLAVPHLTKLIFQTSAHAVLYGATAIMGACLLLLCDMISQMPGYDMTLPINAVTSIIGAPVIVWLLLKNHKVIN